MREDLYHKDDVHVRCDCGLFRIEKRFPTIWHSSALFIYAAATCFS